MKNKIILTVLMLSLFLYSCLSMSGSPGGLVLYVHPFPSGIDHKQHIDDFFYKHYGVDNDKAPSCDVIHAWETFQFQPAVDVFYIKRRVFDINNSLVERSINNDKDRRKLRKILYNYRGEKVKFGFDAILFYGETDGVIHFYGLSSFSKKIKVIESTLLVTEIADEDKLGLALCKVFSQLPVPET